MGDLNDLPYWMKVIPVLLGVGIGLYGASTANRSIVIFGMPAGFVIGFVILGLVVRSKKS